VNPCNLSDSYIPIATEYTPVKKVRLSIHIMQKNDGTGNFQNIPEHKDWIQNQIMRDVNLKMEHLDRMKIPTASRYIQDSRIRYIVDTIYFHRDLLGWDMYCPKYFMMECKLCNSFGDSLYSKYVVKNDKVRNKNNSLHPFFGENQTGKGLANGVGEKQWILISGCYFYYLEQNFWLPSGLIRHELGHSLGLYHTWNEEDFCSDTPMNKGCWNGDSCSNNMMDYNADQSSLTECQLGRMHYFLSGKNGNISETVIPDYCYYDISTIEIFDGDTVKWFCEKRFQGNILLHRNAVLNIFCLISLPKGSAIFFEKKSKLILSGGKITNLCKEKWEGFYLENKKINIKDLIDKGYIEIRGGGLIENIRTELDKK
jgi:hypothetical protein